jgi:hypothetical protein
MEARRSRSKYWILFFVWLVIMIIMLIDIGGETRKYFWLALPGVCTYFALAMDIM